MKIKPGQYEVTRYSDQDRTRLGVDPVARRLEWLLLFLFVIFLAIGGWGLWFVWKM